MSDVAVFDDERKKWLQYDKDTEVLIKHISKEELNEISDKSKKEAKKTGQDFSQIHNRRFGNASVLGWRKIKVIDPEYPDVIPAEHPGFTIGGKPLLFTKENLAMLMAKSLKFSNFVDQSALDADEFLDGVEETKNAS